jgi:hypothetical protein
MHALRLECYEKQHAEIKEGTHAFRGANCEVGGLVPQVPETRLRTPGYSDTDTLCFAAYLATTTSCVVCIVGSDLRPLAGYY